MHSFKKYELTEHLSPKHLVSPKQFENYLASVKKPFMKTFYESLRKDLDIMMEKGKPLGGKFSFDSENRKKLPKNIEIPDRTKAKKDKFVEQVKELVAKEFKKHPGSLDNFVWPYKRQQYLKNIDIFIEQCLASFGPYQDAISDRDPFLFHSLISPGLNLGLIVPQDVLDKVLPLAKAKPKNIASIEGFVRQVVGWREFVRGIYENYNNKMETSNHWSSKRKLKACWWTGETGIDPVDDVIHKCIKYGYAHHIDRLMVMANIFNLIGAHPQEVYRWFMEMFVDSADWVMQANVYGMGLMSEGGIFATKPYICGSNYILKMSDYKSGPWCDIMDGLYWSFIDNNRNFFAKNPRMAMMVKMHDKMDKSKKQRITKAAKDFILKTTN